jgi:glycerol-3-phosphate acyltransferase PlsY
MNFYLYLIVAFVLGGIPFGLIAGYVAGKGDIRKKGSGNIGATNAWRVAGPGAAIFVFAGDIGKGVGAVLLASAFYHQGWPISLPASALLGGFVAVLGHTFSPFLGFRGGKGVNTALGVFLSLMPVETLIAFGVFLVTVFVFRYISLGSIIGAMALTLILWAERLVLKRPVDDLYLAAATILAVLILVTHRENIRRLIKGTENRFQLRKATD